LRVKGGGAYPTRAIQSKLAIFNVLEAGFCHKLLVLSNLEAKFLKTGDLRGLVDRMEPGKATRVYAENTTARDRVAQ
jgi:hypothetical protein